MTDIAIVGKGPAGLSCAMTARMRGLSAVLIAPENDSGLLRSADRVDNYPGLTQVSGKDLLEICLRQALELGAEERFGLVRQIMALDDRFMLLIENDVLEAKTVVLTMGAARSKTLPGEEELLGQGVSYCATCDGMFYRNRRIAVLSGSLQGVEETAFLAGLASEIDYFSLKPHCMERLSEKVRKVDEEPCSLQRVDGGICLTTNAGHQIYDGIFVFRDAMPLHMLMSDLKTEGSFIPVDRQMQTNIPGLFAAGDCTGKPFQVPKAVGEGNVAAIAAAEFIAKRG